MTPNGKIGSSNHNPGPIVLAVLKDMGWQINDFVPIKNEPQKEEIEFYPNQVIDVLTFKSTRFYIPMQITICSICGNVILRKVIDSNVNNINLRELPSGVFALQFIENNIFYTTLFIKN